MGLVVASWKQRETFIASESNMLPLSPTWIGQTYKLLDYELHTHPYPIRNRDLGQSHLALLAEWIWVSGLHLLPERNFV